MDKTLIRLAVLIIFLSLYLPAACQVEHSTPTSSNVLKPPSQLKSRAIFEISEIAYSNHLPLAVIQGNQNLCKFNIEISVDVPLTDASLREQFNRQIPDYYMTVEQGVLTVKPRTVEHGTAEILSTKIEYFRPESTTLEGMGPMLWTYMRALYLPDEPNILSVISNPDEPQLANFRVDSPSTIQSILNRLIVQGGKGTWIISKNAAVPSKLVDRNPITLISYYKGLNFLQQSLCGKIE